MYIPSSRVYVFRTNANRNQIILTLYLCQLRIAMIIHFVYNAIIIMIEHLYLVDVYCIFRPVLRDHHWDKEKMSLYDR